MKALVLLCFAFLVSSFSIVSLAQAPQRINYQAIARSSVTGQVLDNQAIFISFKIRSSSPSGNIVYQESHPNAQTNEFGLFNLQIGGGSPEFGNMETINWAENSFWLEIDLDAGNGLETIGAMQLVSVPFAFHANTVSNADDADADPSNELIDDFLFDNTNGMLSITDAGGTKSVSLAGLIEDADADPTNELIDDFLFDEDTGVLSITDAGGTKTLSLAVLAADADADPTNELVSDLVFDSTNSQLILSQAGGDLEVDLSQLINDADADPTNEKISGIFYNSVSNSITIAEGGENYSTGLGPADNDTDPFNELIDPNGLSLSEDGVLTISEAGTPHQVDLSSLNISYWNKNIITGAVFNITERIGIGATNPSARLEIRAPVNPVEPALRVYTSAGTPALEVNNNVVSTSPSSAMQINGKLILGTKILTSATGFYNVLPEDIVVVVKRLMSGASSITINLPDPETNIGRIIIVKSVGPTLALQSVTVSAPSSFIDFSEASIVLSALGNGSITLVSIGADGWIRL